MSDTIFSVLKERLKERESSTAFFLSQGHAKSYDEYTRMVGYCAAIRELMDDLAEIEKRILED
ncbi:MAG: hypothetical protein ACO3QV_07380 [Candidatus Nanopelagicaceae bacterium]|jgi:hypothetical protein